MNKRTILTLTALSAITLTTIAIGGLYAQPPAGGAARGGRGGFGRGGVATPLFAAADNNKDGSLTRDELKSTFDAWFTGWDAAKTGALTEPQVLAGLEVVFPPPPPPPPPAPGASAAGGFNGGGTQPLSAKQPDIDAMMAALPTAPGAKPLHPRKVLVLAHTGVGGFVHSSIPLAAKTVEALGNKGDLWSTTISYDSADINAANLKQYDAIFLDSTTACFLDDPKDPAATAARRKALLDFVKDGKGLVGIHAATDSYHTDCNPQPAAGGGRAGRGNANTLATQFMAQGDKNGDKKLSRTELASLADMWFDKLDTAKAGKLTEAEFSMRFNGAVMPNPEATPQHGTWPEFNTMIGGFFKFHWTYPQLITVKIDDPKSPLTAMFHGQEFDIRDETYTFAQDSFSRKRVHVLTSIDYAKMSDADKAKEPEGTRRTDGDYALSYIQRVGKGRVFYEGHGHSETIYAMTPMLEHVRAGIQYALGDLKADDSPSVK